MEVLFLPSAVMAGVVFVLFTTIFNGAVLAMYLAALAKRSSRLRKPRVSGRVVDEKNKPISGVIMRLSEPSGILTGVCTTDVEGLFSFRVAADVYQLLSYKSGFVQADSSFLKLDARADRAHTTIKLQKVRQQ